jgi:hypothetical protein
MNEPRRDNSELVHCKSQATVHTLAVETMVLQGLLGRMRLRPSLRVLPGLPGNFKFPVVLLSWFHQCRGLRSCCQGLAS